MPWTSWISKWDACESYPAGAGVLILLCIVGCQPAPPVQDPVSRMGLTETVLGRSSIEDALAIGNSWMDPAMRVRFVPSWLRQNGNSTDAIPVYAISAINSPPTYMIAVPSGCRCVFIQPRAYEDWLDRHLSHGGMTLEVDKTRLLAFMLLHEAGHISHRDLGEFDGSGAGSLSTQASTEKQREQSADAFAVEQLKGALARTKDITPWLNAQRVTMDLANLGFEMQQVRQLKYFGAEVLGTPAAFMTWATRTRTSNCGCSRSTMRSAQTRIHDNFSRTLSSAAVPAVRFCFNRRACQTQGSAEKTRSPTRILAKLAACPWPISRPANLVRSVLHPRCCLAEDPSFDWN